MNPTANEILGMFDKISAKYDNLNNIISLGNDKRIKKTCIELLNINENDIVADLCTGTGDIAGLIYKKTKNVIGLDFSENMLNIAKLKYPKIEFKKADVTNIPFEDNSFDKATIAYGLRNIPDKTKAVKEIYRILKSKGEVLHLDFGNKNFAGKIFETYVPLCAKIFTKNAEAYEYLVNSKQNFLTPEKLIELFKSNGFKLKTRKDFLFKSITCEIFSKI